MEKQRHRVRPTKYFNGEVIRELREARDFSQDRLAQLAKTTKANISKWERARRQVEISYELFLALAEALYIPPEELARKLATPVAEEPPHPVRSTKR